MSYDIFRAQVQDKFGCWTECTINGESYITPHLKWGEIANYQCKEDIKLVLPYKSIIYFSQWEELRNYYGSPLKITSGYRSPSFNKEVHGASNSLHLTMQATDNHPYKAITDALFAQFCNWGLAIAHKYGNQCEIGRYDSYIHMGFGTLSYTEQEIFIYDKRQHK